MTAKKRHALGGHKGLTCATFLLVMLASRDAMALATMGDRSCGTWATRKQDFTTDISSTAWLTGFMTGMAVGTSVDVLRDVDGDSVLLWMDNYCKAHPLDKVATGAATLFIELRGRMHQ
jgi:hypothetical protein